MPQPVSLLFGIQSPKRTLVEGILREQGYDVDVVEDIEAVHARTAADPPGLLVITDPCEEAVQICRSLQERGPEASTVVVVVPDEGTPLPEQALRLGAQGCLLAWPDPRALRTHISFASFHLNARVRLHEAMQERSRVSAEALRESEALTQAFLDTTVDAVITIDERGLVETFNPAAERIFGYQAEEIIGKNVSLLMPAPYNEEHDAYIQRYIRTGERQVIGIGREVVGLRKDGTTFPMELALSELQLQDRRVFADIVRDITERRLLEKEILRISDQERRRIGQDMHDGLGQMLTGIGLISQNLAHRMRKDNRSCASDIEEITQLVKEADQYARSLSRSLVPVDLEHNGLIGALERLARNAERLFGIRCSFEHSGTLPTESENWSVHLYRIAQEAVSNAVKHGNATHVRVTLASGHDRIRLLVQDNGSGLEPSWKESRGMGVRLMAYRAHIIGAALDIGNGHAGGAVVRCTLRFQQKTTPSVPEPSIP